MHRCRGWSLLLLPSGLAAGHMLGYAVAALGGHVPSIGDGDHSYLQTLLVWSVPLSAMVLARVLLGGVRRERLSITFGRLAVQQVVAFVGLEMIEHLHTGVGPVETLTEPTMVVGILAQLLVAYGVVMLLRGAGTVAGRLTRRRVEPRRPPIGTGRPPGPVPVPAGVPLSSLLPRGPPVAFG